MNIARIFGICGSGSSSSFSGLGNQDRVKGYYLKAMRSQNSLPSRKKYRWTVSFFWYRTYVYLSYNNLHNVYVMSLRFSYLKYSVAKVDYAKCSLTVNIRGLEEILLSPYSVWLALLHPIQTMDLFTSVLHLSKEFQWNACRYCRRNLINEFPLHHRNILANIAPY